MEANLTKNNLRQELDLKLEEQKSKFEKYRAKYPDKKIWSISKINSFEDCPQQYYLTYIKKVKQDDNVYGVLGSLVHELIESYYKNELTREQMIMKFHKDFNSNDLKFPSDKIKQSWFKAVSHFLCNHKKENKEFLSEKLVINVLNKELFRGYIDMILFNQGSIEILDWKTSSKFSGKKLLHAGRQLLFYKQCLDKLGYEVSSIKWNMLKYCHITYITESGKVSTKVESRDKVTEIKNIQKIEDYIVEYTSTEELINEMQDYFTKVISEIKNLEDNYQEQQNKYSCSGEEFFCENLCGVKKYCARYNYQEIKDEDLSIEDLI